MLHSLHLDIPVLTKIWGGIGVGVIMPDGDVIGWDGDICCALVASFAPDEDNLKASSMLCLTSNCGGMTLRAGSDKRKAMSAGSNGRIRSEWDVDEFGEIDTLLPRGLFERRLGEGVNGGLPGNEGAQTICSGVIESPLTDKFSLPSIIASNSIRNWSADIADESDRLRSREFEPGDIRRTDKSKGVDVSLLWKEEKLTIKFTVFIAVVVCLLSVATSLIDSLQNFACLSWIGTASFASLRFSWSLRSHTRCSWWVQLLMLSVRAWRRNWR